MVVDLDIVSGSSATARMSAFHPFRTLAADVRFRLIADTNVLLPPMSQERAANAGEMLLRWAPREIRAKPRRYLDAADAERTVAPAQGQPPK